MTALGYEAAGRIRVVLNRHYLKGVNRTDGWTWKIDVGSVSNGRFRCEAVVCSKWRYETWQSAELAAQRWLGRLGLTELED
jgi:hypothetical protein